MDFPDKKRYRMTSTRLNKFKGWNLMRKKRLEERHSLAIEEGARLYKHTIAVDKVRVKTRNSCN